MSTVVLVIEDHASLREVIADVLQMHGYKVLDAANGADGIGMAREHHPDLVLSDYYMPEADGLDVLRALRTDPFTAEVPFVMMSMESGSWLRDAAIADGANEFLQKPFEFQDLIDVVRGQIDQNQYARA